MFKRIVYLLAFLSLVSAGPSFGGTTWRGRRAMRVSVCNWQTSDEDVDSSSQSGSQRSDL